MKILPESIVGKRLKQLSPRLLLLLSGNGENCNVLIPNVLTEAEMQNLLARFLGVGEIAARYLEKDDSWMVRDGDDPVEFSERWKLIPCQPNNRLKFNMIDKRIEYYY